VDARRSAHGADGGHADRRLDGFLDPYFQEVYLDADSIPIFSKLAKELSADTVDDYIEALDGPEEAEMVGHLLKLRNSIQRRGAEADRATDMTDVQDAALKSVNAYFERALRSVPEIDAYLAEIVARAP
jgi:hypothetical protein